LLKVYLWLWLIKGIASSYQAVYSLVRGELKSKLKIPRPRSISQKSTAINTTSPKICYNRTQAGKDDFMKVNYQERIEDTVTELKIIMSQQRTITNRQKVQALYLLKSGWSPSITDVAELVRVHRITVLRLFKQYSEGGLSLLLKLGQSTGRPRAISSEIIAGLKQKSSPNQAQTGFISGKYVHIFLQPAYKSIRYSCSKS
jgi:hypothetical protein